MASATDIMSWGHVIIVLFLLAVQGDIVASATDIMSWGHVIIVLCSC